MHMELKLIKLYRILSMEEAMVPKERLESMAGVGKMAGMGRLVDFILLSMKPKKYFRRDIICSF